MVTNLEAAEKLAKRYESISLSEIQKQFEKCSYMDIIREELTGFGRIVSCTLCIAVGRNAGDHEKCRLCIHNFSEVVQRTEKELLPPCAWHSTYDSINNATTPDTLLKAYRDRAVYLKKLLEINGYEL